MEILIISIALYLFVGMYVLFSSPYRLRSEEMAAYLRKAAQEQPFPWGKWLYELCAGPLLPLMQLLCLLLMVVMWPLLFFKSR